MVRILKIVFMYGNLVKIVVKVWKFVLFISIVEILIVVWDSFCNVKEFSNIFITKLMQNATIRHRNHCRRSSLELTMIFQNLVFNNKKKNKLSSFKEIFKKS